MQQITYRGGIAYYYEEILKNGINEKGNMNI